MEVSVDLQSILNKSVERLLESSASDWNEYDLLDLKMILGFDSSSGDLNPQQGYEQSENENVNAFQSLFVSSMIIIKMKSQVSNQSGRNPTPQIPAQS